MLSGSEVTLIQEVSEISHMIIMCHGAGRGRSAADLWTQPPLARVDITIHDDPLDLGTEAVVACHHLRRTHYPNACREGADASGPEVM